MRVEHLRDEPYSNDDILKATSMEVVNTMRDLLHLNPLYGEQFRTLLSLSEWGPAKGPCLHLCVRVLACSCCVWICAYLYVYVHIRVCFCVYARVHVCSHKPA